MRKLVSSVFITIFSVFIFCEGIIAQEQTDPIIDTRCASEKLLTPDGCYATGCWTDNISTGVPVVVSCYPEGGCKNSGNKESFMRGLTQHCDASPNEADHVEDFELFQSDIVFNRSTIPLILIMILSVVLGMLGLVAIGVTFFGYIKWVNLSNKGENLEAAWNYFTNGLWGVLIVAGAIPISWLIFYLTGYQANPFDFDDVADRLFIVDCGVKDRDECTQYDQSCIWDVSIAQNEETIACINRE